MVKHHHLLDQSVESGMKIDERISNYLALLNSDSGSAVVQNTTPHTALSPTSPSAEVTISPAASLQADDDARRARLDAIRQQLAEGSYNISGKDVADKILNVLKN